MMLKKISNILLFIGSILLFIGIIGLINFVGFSIGNGLGLLIYSHSPLEGVNYTQIFWKLEYMYWDILKWSIAPLKWSIAPLMLGGLILQLTKDLKS